MGREIRRIPLGWEHPKKDYPDYRTGRMESRYRPLYNHDAEEAWADWQADYKKWLDGELAESLAKYPEEGYTLETPYASYCAWNGMPPHPEYHRPKWTEAEMNGYAMYETVSEGTPVTPTFASLEELADHLTQHGTYWDGTPWSREAADGFVKSGWAPSMVFSPATGIVTPSDERMYSK